MIIFLTGVGGEVTFAYMGEVTGTRERQHRRSERFPKLEPFPKLIERFDPTGSAIGSVVIPWPSSRCRAARWSLAVCSP